MWNWWQYWFGGGLFFFKCCDQDFLSWYIYVIVSFLFSSCFRGDVSCLICVANKNSLTGAAVCFNIYRKPFGGKDHILKCCCSSSLFCLHSHPKGSLTKASSQSHPTPLWISQQNSSVQMSVSSLSSTNCKNVAPKHLNQALLWPPLLLLPPMSWALPSV